MKFIKRTLNKIYSIFVNFIMITKIIILSFCYKNKVYIFGAPIHGNIGDHAIIYAEKNF